MSAIREMAAMLAHTPLLTAALLVTFALLGLETFIVVGGHRCAPNDVGDEQ